MRDASIKQVFSTSDWATRNNTRFRNTSLSEANFNVITDGSQINVAFENGTQPDNDGVTNEGSKSRVNRLTAGKVFAFQTANGKNGLAHVVSVQEGETGSIRLNIKVIR